MQNDNPPMELDSRHMSETKQTPETETRQSAGSSRITKAVIVLLLAVCYIKILLVYTEVFDSGLGDGSVRIVISNKLSQEPGAYYSRGFFTSYWSYGPFITQGVFLKLFRFLGVADGLSIVKFFLMQASVLFTLGVFFMYRALSRFQDEWAGLFAVFALLGNEINNLMSLSSNAETYAFFYLSLAIWLLAGRSSRLVNVVLAGLALMMAQLCRGEIALLTLLFASFLFFNRKFFSAIVLFALGNAAIIAKPFVLRTLGITDAISSFNIKQMYVPYENWTELLMTIVSSGVEISKSPDVVILAIGVLGSLFMIFSKGLRIVPLTIFGYLAIFVAMWLFIVQTRFGARFFYLELILLNCAAGISCSMFIAFFRDRKSRVFTVRIATALLVLFGGYNLFLFSRVHARESHSHLSTYIALPDEISAARRWLNAHIDDDDTLQLDYLRGWDQYLHAQTERATFIRGTLQYASSPPIRSKYDWSLVNDQPGIAKTVRAHLHILEYHPKYLVLAGEKLILSKEHKFYATHKRRSYLRPYMTDIDAEGLRLFQSDYVEHKPIKLKEVYRNSHIEIVEVIYSEPAGPIE